MKNLKNLKLLSLALIGSLCLSSCVVDDEIKKDTELFNGPLVVGFKNSKIPANFIQESGATFDYSVPTALLGGASGQPSNSEIKISYELGTLDDVNLTPDDLAKFNTMLDVNNTPNDPTDDVRKFPLAKQGVHFDYKSSTPQVTIPAGGTFDQIGLSVYNDALDAGKVTLLVLKLTTVTTVDNVVVSSQQKATVLQLQLCRVDLAGNYKITFSSGATRPVTITQLEPGLYRASYLPPFGSYYTFDFTACAGELTMVGWQFNSNNSSGAQYYITQATPGTETNNNLTFTGVSMTDISWYVNRSFTFEKL